MPDEKKSARIICLGGLISSENHILLSEVEPGSASRLINYEVGLNGGYRRLTGYQYFDSNYPEVGVGTCEGKILGIIIFDNTVTGETEYYAARKLIGVNEYELYLYNNASGWGLVTTGITREYTNGVNSVVKLRWDVANDGEKNYLAIVDGVNPALLFDGTTWAEITPSGTGSGIATAGGAQALEIPHLVSFSSSTLFLACDDLNGYEGIVCYSSPNQFYNFDSANGAGQAIPGFPIKQIKPFRKNLYLFGNNAISFLYPDISAGFLKEDVTRDIGLIARDAVIELGGDLIFLGPDGFRPIAGTDKIGDVQLECISKNVVDNIRRYTEFIEDTDAVNMTVLRNKSQFRIFFSNDNLDTVDAQGFIGCLRTADQQKGWEFSEMLGFRVSCVTSRYVGPEEYVIHGDYDGKVYRQEQGNDLNGTQMFSRYDTPYLDFGDTEIRKVIEKVTIFLKGAGNLVMTMGVQYDWGNSAVSNPTNYILDINSTAISYGDGSTYGDGSIYGGVLYPVQVTNVEGSFFSVRLRFVTSGSDVPYTIYGMVFEFSPKGRI